MQQRQAVQPGWQTAFDVAIAPRAAFTALRAAPTWGWAFLIAASLAILSTLSVSSVYESIFEREVRAQVQTDPQAAQLPADQREALVEPQLRFARAAVFVALAWVPFGLAAGCALKALVMLIANAIGGGKGTFKTFWALAVNAAVVGDGIAAVALTAIILLGGRGGFLSTTDIANALPGLGTFVPPEAKAAAAFLGELNVFTLWDAGLLAAGMMVVARLPRGTAIAAAALIVLGTGLIALLPAAFQK